ncbi:hypothetical protein [Leptolyngbya sp. PCC 6406]|uniref:hypothetical protein n=1 Tax=Leptolyngbya sp. PCC 6406 TaxID=1173264 RepID=UPI0002AC25B9|nr:hypothetical protein [Leptolyngbya sp. PCC 6406]
MNSYTHYTTTLLDQQRQHLDTLVSRPDETAFQPSRLGEVVAQIGHALVNYFATGSHPRISQAVRQGHAVWKVYDPISDRVHYFDHEDEVRVWLDQRFYE